MPWGLSDFIITAGKSWVDNVKNLHVQTPDFYLIKSFDIQNQTKSCNKKTQCSPEVFPSQVFVMENNYVNQCVDLCRCSCHSTSVEARAQLMGAGSLLPWCGSWESNSGPQSGWQVPFTHKAILPAPQVGLCQDLAARQPPDSCLFCTPLLDFIAHLEPDAAPGVKNTDGTFVMDTAVCCEPEVGQRGGWSSSGRALGKQSDGRGKQPLCTELDRRTLEKSAAQVPEFSIGRLNSDRTHLTQECEQKLTVLKRIGIRKFKVFKVKFEALEVL